MHASLFDTTTNDHWFILTSETTHSAGTIFLYFSKIYSLSDVILLQWPLPQIDRSPSSLLQFRDIKGLSVWQGKVLLQMLRSERWKTKPTLQFKDSKDHLKYLLTPFGFLTFIWTSKKSVSKHKKWNRITVDLPVNFPQVSLSDWWNEFSIFEFFNGHSGCVTLCRVCAVLVDNVG